MNFANVKKWRITEGDVTRVTDSQGRVLWQKPVDYFEPFYIENITNNNESVRIYCDGETTPALGKSDDGINWTSVEIHLNQSVYITLVPNQKMYLRFKVSNGYDETDLHITDVSKVGGNVMSLLYGSNFNGQTEFPANHGMNAFQGLFRDNTLLTDASKLLLPATTVPRYSYGFMFLRCSSLIAAPELPATTLSEYCYDYLFGSCTSLTTAPELLATRLANKCYSRLFMDCTNLTYVKCLATTNVNETNCNNWLLRASNTGTFVKKSGISWSSSTSGIPSGWTVQEV